MFVLDRKLPRNEGVEKMGFLLSLFLFLSIVNVVARVGIDKQSIKLPMLLFAISLLILLSSRGKAKRGRSLAAGMKLFGQLINDIVVGAGLLIVYFFGVGLTALIARVLRKRLLDMPEKKSTYWKKLDLEKQERSAYFDQF